MISLLKPHLLGRRQGLNLYQPKAGDGCILWLPGQDDPYSSTIRDRSGNGNDGAITGAVWVQVPSSGLWYLDLDGGDDIIEATTLTDVTVGGTYSISIWVKTNDPTEEQQVVTNSLSGTDRNGLNILTSILRFGIYDGAWAGKSGTITTAWTHAFCINSAKTLTLLMDGIVQTGTADPYSDGDLTYLRIGNRSAADRGVNGGLALAKIFSVAHTVAFGQQIYQEERHLFGV